MMKNLPGHEIQSKQMGDSHRWIRFYPSTNRDKLSDAYYGITGNDTGLKHFRYGVRQRWQKWRNRRSQRSGMPWDRFHHLLDHSPLPKTRIVHAASSA